MGTMISRLKWTRSRLEFQLLGAVIAACKALDRWQKKAARRMSALLSRLSERASEAQFGRGESLQIQRAVRAGGSSDAFAQLFELRLGQPMPPMSIEHGVTMNKNHDAFSLEPARASEPLSKAELEAMARALNGGSTEHLR